MRFTLTDMWNPFWKLSRPALGFVGSPSRRNGHQRNKSPNSVNGGMNGWLNEWMNAQTVGHVNSVCQVTTVYRVFFQLTAAARFQCTITEQIKVFSRTELSNLLARPVTLGLANIPSGPTHQCFSSETRIPGTWNSAARIVTRLRVLTHWGRGHLNCLNPRYRGF